MESLGLSGPYEEINYEDLDEEQKEEVDSLNLAEMFHREIQGSETIDLGIIRFVLRRLGQLGDSSLVEEILQELDVLHPVFPDIIRYFSKLKYLSPADKRVLAGRVLDLFGNSIISELDYHRMWALELFTHSTEWGNEDKFLRQLSLLRGPADPSRRKLILALGKASVQHWFQTRWRSWDEEPPWSKRALIAAASCLPSDARTHWYKSIEARLDPLEVAVAHWAQENPFG
jgi:hypothetical protein